MVKNKNCKCDYVYIDPQSYNNLSLYDKGVLMNFEKNKVAFFGSILWDCPVMNNVESFMWFKYNKYSNPILKGISYFVSILKIIKYIKSNKPKLVHIQWTRLMPLDTLFIYYLKKIHIKTVFTAHNVLPHDSGEKYFEQFKKYYGLVDKIIVHSTKTKHEIIDLFSIEPSKVDVIPHGIIKMDGNAPLIKNRVEELRKEHSLLDKKIFSSLGVQSIYKGVDHLINVWGQNKDYFEQHNCHLLIVGKNSGIDYGPLNGNKNVTIVDEKISNLDFLSFIRLSDVILLPYIKISQSGVLFSAIDNNVPVMVSDVGGLKEPLQYGKVGWCIGDPTEENIRKVLMYLAQNPQEIQNVKNDVAAFDAVKNIYSWDKISSMTETLYKSLISKL